MLIHLSKGCEIFAFYTPSSSESRIMYLLIRKNKTKQKTAVVNTEIIFKK